MAAPSHEPSWKTVLAFAIIYLVWGSTFLAIRVGVREVPPFLLAAIRFLIAGLVFLWLDDRPGRAFTERALVLISVVVITIARVKKPAATLSVRRYTVTPD